MFSVKGFYVACALWGALIVLGAAASAMGLWVAGVVAFAGMFALTWYIAGLAIIDLSEDDITERW